MSDAARLKNTCYVGGLDPAVTKDALTQAFLPFGEIVDVTLPTDPHRGFGYVEFESPDDAREAIDNMDQSMLAGRVLSVAQAKPQKDTSAILNSKTAVWEQEDWLKKYEVSEEDRAAAEKARLETMSKETDPMQGLEGLDVAGPKQA